MKTVEGNLRGYESPTLRQIVRTGPAARVRVEMILSEALPRKNRCHALQRRNVFGRATSIRALRAAYPHPAEDRGARRARRPEEHTSALQSRFDLIYRRLVDNR